MADVAKLAEFLALLGGLVFFHELGHFVIAKWCGVKVLKFSLGFGPKLVGFTHGETEYVIAALPLGGYVRMLGEDPTQKIEPVDRGRGFGEQVWWKRAAIAFAGPGVNLLLPLIVFFGIYMVPQMQDPPVVSVVIPNEPADRAGVQPRDRVLSVDGVTTRSFDEMREAIEARAGKPIDLVVRRDGVEKTLHVTPSSETERSPVETTQKGKIGVMTGKLPSVIGVVPGSRAWNAGLRTFDRIASVNGQQLSTIVDLDDAVKKIGPSSALHLEAVRSAEVDLKTSAIATAKAVTIDVPAGADALGIESPDLYVREVEPGSHAEAAGLKPLDKIVAAEGQPVLSWMRLQSFIEDKKTVHLQVDRAGQRIDLSFDTVMVEREGKMSKITGPESVMDYGFRFHPLSPEPFPESELVLVKYTMPQAAGRAVTATVEITRQMVMGIGALFTGRIPLKKVGGAYQMYQLTAVYAEQGLASFFSIFALISINLGIINLIPVPVLDGFHIVVAVVEGVSRRTVPIKAREYANIVGLVMLLMLMILANGNDFFRWLGKSW